MSNTNTRNNYNNNVKKSSTKCFISKVSSPQAENSHILPLNTCEVLGYKEHAESGNNHLFLSKNLHVTFELEKRTPTWTLERVGDIGPVETKYKVKILDKPRFLEEQKYKDKIYSIDSFKVPYLEIHYGLCCNLYGIKFSPFYLINLLDKSFIFYNMFQEYLEYINKKDEKTDEKPDEKTDEKTNKKKRKKKSSEINTKPDKKKRKKDDNSLELYNVTKILDHRPDTNTFYIEWEGVDENGKKWENQWIPKTYITDYTIQEYFKNKDLKK